MALYNRVLSKDPITLPAENWLTYVNGSQKTSRYWTKPAYVPLLTEGNNILNYHKKKRNGHLLRHTLFRQTEVLEYWYVGRSIKTELDNLTWNTEFVNHPPATTLPGIYHSADTSGAAAEMQRAASNLYTKGFDALTFVSEMHKTRSLFEGMAKRLKSLASNRGRLRSAKEIYRLWLEGKYGWGILARDVQSLHEAMTEFDRKRRIWSERSGFSYYESDTEESSGSSSGGRYSFVQTLEKRTEHSIRGIVTAKVELDRFVTNPANTAWELIPFSFVLDWAISVGNTINAANLVMQSSGLESSIGYQSVSTGELSRTYTPNPGVHFVIDQSGVVIAKQKTRLQVRTPTKLSLLPKVNNRLIRPDQLLDLRALFEVRGSLSKAIR